MIAPPLIYIAGPFSAKTRAGVDENIHVAELAGLDIARLGGMPVIPHANTSHPEFERVRGYEFWIAGTMRLLRCCDAVYLTHNWRESSGATGEQLEALRIWIPVFEKLSDVGAFINGWRRARSSSGKDDGGVL